VPKPLAGLEQYQPAAQPLLTLASLDRQLQLAQLGMRIVGEPDILVRSHRHVDDRKSPFRVRNQIVSGVPVKPLE
jgi:hypothetical protein